MSETLKIKKEERKSKEKTESLKKGIKLRKKSFSNV